MLPPLIFPPEFESRMRRNLSEEWKDFSDAHLQPAPVSIRLNPEKPGPHKALPPVPWSSSGKYLDQRPVFTLDPLFHAGAYYVQEASSMFLEQAVSQCCPLEKPLKVLDLSAAPGGKSTHLLSLLHPDSLLVSNEVIRSRSAVLAENIQKWGYHNCLVTNNDPADFSALAGFFDVIVVDAPCSGEGLFRKERESINQWSSENVDLCAARQKRILQDVWPSLKEDGILIYSTCTYNAVENEQNLSAFAASHPVEFLSLKTDPRWNVSHIREGDVTGYRFFPHKVNGEGFFISVMKKRSQPPGNGKQKKMPRLSETSKRNRDTISPWIRLPENFGFFQHDDLIFLLPAHAVHEIGTLLHHLRFVYGGTNVARVKHDKFVPEHALALSIVLEESFFPAAELDHPTCIRYLRRESIVLPDLPKGYALMKFMGMPVGWVNNLESRVNNLYPQEWRIRMLPAKDGGKTELH